MLQYGIVLCASLAFTAGIAPGAVIYSTFTSTPPGYVDNIFFSIVAGTAGPPSPPPFPTLVAKTEVAMGFVPTVSAVAERVSVPLMFYSGQVRFLLAESLNGVPGTVLDSVAFGSDPSSPLDLYTGQFPSAPSLTAGQLYWLIGSIEGNTGSVSWAGAGHGPAIFASRSIDPFMPPPPTWNVSPATFFGIAAFHIEGQLAGSPVPEPGTLVVTCLGVLGLAIVRRSRH